MWTERQIADSEVILLADDEENDIFLFRRACQKEGVDHLIRTVTNGEQVLSYLEGQPPYDDREKFPFARLLLLDVKMPRMDGFEVLNRIRSSRRLHELPVIFFTSSNHPEDRERAFQLGAVGYYCKNIDLDVTRHFVRRLCQKWLGHADLAH